MNHLTRQERFVLCVAIGLLLTGWAVRAYRQGHPLAERGAAVQTGIVINH